MAKERRDNQEVLVAISVVQVKVEDIIKRLDKINGSIEGYNKTCPVYQNKVDAMEKDLGTFKLEIRPVVNNIKIKVYGLAALIAVFSSTLTIIVNKLIGG